MNEEGFPHQGRVDFFDNQVDPQDRHHPGAGGVRNPDRALVPGMFANAARAGRSAAAETLLIPDVAVGSDQGYKFVYVVNHDNVVENRPVEAGRAHGDLRAVLKGLTPEDRVIVNGLI